MTLLRGVAGRIAPSVPSAVVIVAAITAVAALTLVRPAQAGAVVLFGAIGLGLAVLGLGVPIVAVMLLLLTLFFRLPLSGILPADPFLLAFSGVIGAMAVAAARRSIPKIRFGLIELAMALYLLWNVGSSLASHPYPATVPITGQDVSVWRFILSGTAIPFVLFVVGRFAVVRTSSLRWLLWLILALTAYSAAMSFFQLNGPTSLVWPRYIIASPDWNNRAVGIFNQPVVNGLVLIIGFTVALLVASQSGRWWSRAVAVGTALGSAYGVYLTHTRAVWLAFALVLVMGALFAAGFRLGFLLTLATACLAIATNWSTFISSDRADGGVASAGEVEDRLNTIATSFWAIEHRPLLGWGIGRFVAVNTYDHKQWTPETPWLRGFGIASHFNELGIAAELGLVGLVLWLAVLLLVAHRLYGAFRALDQPALWSRGLTFLAASSFVALVVTGFTVDLRYFDFPNPLVMLLVGVAIGAADRARTSPPPVVDPPAHFGPRRAVAVGAWS